MSRRTVLAAALGLALAAPAVDAPALAISKVVGFGDSITRGKFDEQNRGGYPGRLSNQLNRRGLEDVEVVNAGVDGELTGGGVFRIDAVLNSAGGDVYIIMEGTNDVNLVLDGFISLETVAFNLRQMGNKVRDRGKEVIFGTLFPRRFDARQDRSSVFTRELSFEIRDLAVGLGTDVGDVWERFWFDPDLFDDFFYLGGGDLVGHPNGEGYREMARLFADQVAGFDDQAPVVSRWQKSPAGDPIRGQDRITAQVHEFGSTLLRRGTYITLNGREVDTRKTGGKQRLELTYQVKRADLECGGTVGVRTEDNADPPNVRHRVLDSFRVQGVQVIKGDANGDCRVDGQDLLLLARAFGSIAGENRFNRLADFNNDGRIDGEDLATLARNFGRSSA